MNLLEDLLFWTDNRNQPRKINIKKAALTGGFNGSWETWSGSKTNNPPNSSSKEATMHLREEI